MQGASSQIFLANERTAPLAVGVQDFEEIQISGKKFSTARKRLVLTQEELAQKLEMSLSNVRRIEREPSTTISPKYIRKLAAMRGIEPEMQLKELAVDSAPASNGDTPPDSDAIAGTLARIPRIPDLAELKVLNNDQLIEYTEQIILLTLDLRKLLADRRIAWPSEQPAAKAKMAAKRISVADATRKKN